MTNDQLKTNSHSSFRPARRNPFLYQGISRQARDEGVRARDAGRGGFTLVETIVYVAILSIFASVAINFFWQMRQAEVKADVRNQVKENAAQVIETFKYVVRRADSIHQGNSRLEANPSILELRSSNGTWIMDSYLTSVTIGGVPKNIRKLRVTHTGEGSYDLTSDQITVDNFTVNDLTQGGSLGVLQMQLSLSAVNPGDDPLYDDSFSSVITSVIREEL